MTNRILTDLDAMMAPFVECDESRGHEVMATLLDPRFCLGEIFTIANIGTCTEERNCGRAAKVVMREHEVKMLLPALCALAKSRDDEA
jgi:hypothetical protein